MTIKQLLEGFKLYEPLGILAYILLLIAIIAISIINQKYGFKIIKIVDEYSLTKFNKLKQVIIIWIIHLTVCFSLCFVQTILYFNSALIFISMIFYSIIIPLLYSMSFISWSVSIIFAENIEIIRNRITGSNGKLVKSNYLTEINKFMLINYNKLSKINSYLSFGFIIITIICIFGILTLDYFIIHSIK